ncbi:kinase-like domain-containing protein, partial [Ochromonadaceae sp. CCMP2298]
KKLDSGSFSEVYKYVDQASLDFYAVKIEKKGRNLQLRHEAKVYRLLEGMPRFAKTWGWYDLPYVNVLVMELLGPNLEQLFQQCGRFSVKTMLKLADQMLAGIELLHSVSVVHRDIKPSNFVMGLGGRENSLIMVDFGLASTIRVINKHSSSLVGTARYASINSHLGDRGNCRDDLESIAYCLIYFLRGSLPWQGLEAQGREDKYRKIMQKNQTSSEDELCGGLPEEFADFLTYSRSLAYAQDPEYAGINRMFRALGKRQ